MLQGRSLANLVPEGERAVLAWFAGGVGLFRSGL